MSTTRHPYPPSPEVQARNDAHRAVLAQVDELATSPLHAYRARVRLAARVPPPTVPTGQQVDDAVADTVPQVDATQLVAEQRAARRERLRLVS
ncbi:hypothetical protein [Klenkia brasiliensis]|uniref:Uncharacterized protein n=1 Tax=Klenkia brasiliensis TaxID=333142 RepID=A0A1G7YH10_9ACTN|nr:hypothetical protein [Klenkia brasiliensis]SDG95882.1 hypothetical protein SAMN05660324_3960 [Klenkia brasiliensis]